MISMDRVDSIRKKYRRGEPVAAIARELDWNKDENTRKDNKEEA